jgi:hypothetical protein
LLTEMLYCPVEYLLFSYCHVVHSPRKALIAMSKMDRPEMQIQNVMNRESGVK